MNVRQLQAAIEAILFANGEPVSLDKLSEALEVDKNTIKGVIKNMSDEYEDEKRGLYVILVDGKYQLCSKSLYGKYVKKFMDNRRNTPLSQAAMEVLAIIAYNQPVTKSFVEQIRGVDCAGIIGSLCTKNLIEEKGRLELPGKPLLYGTTPTFLRCFCIKNLDELPPIPSKQSNLCQ